MPILRAKKALVEARQDGDQYHYLIKKT